MVQVRHVGERRQKHAVRIDPRLTAGAMRFEPTQHIKANMNGVPGFWHTDFDVLSQLFGSGPSSSLAKAPRLLAGDLALTRRQSVLLSPRRCFG